MSQAGASRTSGTSRTERSPEAERLRRWGFAAIALAVLLCLGWLGFEGRVLEAFGEARSAAPTRLHTAPLVLRVGAAPDPEGVRAHLDAAGYRPAEGPAGAGEAVADGDGGDPRGVDRGEYRMEAREWRIGRRPYRIGSELRPGGLLRVELDARGRITRLSAGEAGEHAAGAAPAGAVEVATVEPVLLGTLLPPDDRDRIPVPLAEIPASLVQAVLAIEDRRFREHGGLDVRRTLGALLANIREGRVAQGGSTLTQQLARSLLLSRERTLWRKVREAALALALDRRLAKDEILEAYLNHVYLGHVDGVEVHGVGRAARAYFGRDVSELTVAEGALLAGLIQAPNRYGPGKDPAAARARRDVVLAAMEEIGAISGAEHAALREVRVPAPPERGGDRPAAYFTEWAERRLAERRPGTDPGRSGLAITTTLSPALQAAAERAVREGLSELERRYPWQARRGEAPLQAALVALDPATGDVLAMVGGREHAASPFNRAVDARRQPGSVFKPLVALAALTREGAPGPGAEGAARTTSGSGGEAGRRRAPDAYTLATTLRDEPITVETDEGPWSPVNHDGEFRGAVTLRGALVASRNLPFVRLGLQLGPEPIVGTARRLGIRSPLRPVPSLALGASEVSVLEITGAYAVLGASGVRAPPRAIRSIREGDAAWESRAAWESGAAGKGDAAGEGGAVGESRSGSLAPERVGDRPAPDTSRVVPAEDARRLTVALEAAVRYGTGRGVRARGYRGPVAAKSGSTDGYRDAWFVGYTPELAVGVWVGYDDGRPLGLPGNVAALPLFADFLISALGPEGGADFPEPGEGRTVAAAGSR